MKILFLAHRLPYPPNKGDKIRSINIIKYLSQNHDIHLACPVDNAGDIQHVKELKRFCKSIDYVKINPTLKKLVSICYIAGKKPLSVRSFYSTALQKKIDSRIQNEAVDFVYVFSSQMAEYLLKHTDLKRIMDFVDIDSAKWRQYAEHLRNPALKWVYRTEANKLETYEIEIAKTFDNSIFVSDSECEKFTTSVYNSNKVIAIHNGVDYHYFTPDEENNVRENIILFTGAMDYYPNIDAVIWFVKSIFPKIKQSITDIKFMIVGSNPVKAVRKLHNGKDIIVTGFVSDIRDYFNQAKVFVAPLRIACGVQNKVLEALSMNLPVIASSLAVKGIKDGHSIAVCDDENEFSNHVIHHLTIKRKSHNYREWLIDNYNWDRNLKDIETLFGSISKLYF